MAVEKNELGAGVVQICVDIVFLRDRREAAVIKKPDRRHRLADRSNFHLIARAGAVDVFVQAIVKKIIAVAASRIGRTNPD